jgi:hypothetical protein
MTMAGVRTQRNFPAAQRIFPAAQRNFPAFAGYVKSHVKI